MAAAVHRCSCGRLCDGPTVATAPDAGRFVHVGPLVIDLDSEMLSIDGTVRPFYTTRSGVSGRNEWLMLEALARRSGRVVPHLALAEHIWGRDNTANRRKAIRMVANRLRTRLGPVAASLIVTVPDRGLLLTDGSMPI